MVEITTFSGHVDGVATRKDRSIKITFTTAQEISDPEQLAKLFQLSDHPISIAIKEGNISDEELLNIPEPEEDYRGQKSKAQRLRGVMYKWWEVMGKPGKFDSFYESRMEGLIDQVKEKL